MMTTRLAAKPFLLGVSLSLAAALFCGRPAPVRAQQGIAGQSSGSGISSRSPYVISMRAGAINFVAGTATRVRRDGAGRDALTSKDELDAGDAIETGSDGNVEVLLAPGSYLRLAPNTLVQLTSDVLDDISLRISRGSAIAELASLEKSALLARINTPHTSIALTRAGIYRFDVTDNATVLSVRKGEVRLSDRTAPVVVKKGKKIVLSGTVAPAMQEEVASTGKNDDDAFDAWSKERASSLARLNRRLTDSATGPAINSFLNSSWYSLSRFSPAGLWVFSPFYGYSTFLPFYEGLSSPYGYGYNFGFGIPYYMRHHWRPGTARSTPTGNSTSQSAAGSSTRGATGSGSRGTSQSSGTGRASSNSTQRSFPVQSPSRSSGSAQSPARGRSHR